MRGHEAHGLPTIRTRDDIRFEKLTATPDRPLHADDACDDDIAGDDNVEQSMMLLLRTLTGERPMRPTFGTRIAEYLFHGESERNLRGIEDAVTTAVREFEPRVRLDGVRATVRPDDDTGVEVQVEYSINATNSRRNIVFPFYDRMLGVFG